MAATKLAAAFESRRTCREDGLAAEPRQMAALKEGVKVELLRLICGVGSAGAYRRAGAWEGGGPTPRPNRSPVPVPGAG